MQELLLRTQISSLKARIYLKIYMTNLKLLKRELEVKPNVTFLLELTFSTVKYFCSERILVKILPLPALRLWKKTYMGTLC